MSTKIWSILNGDGTKIVFFQIRDYAGLESTTYSDEIGLDSTPPTGSIVINNGDTWTTSNSATLTLTYSDQLAGVSRVRYGNDGSWDTEPWESPSVFKAWNLTLGEGAKTVYYQVEDSAGLASVTFNDNIGLDDNPPCGSILINNDDPWTTTTSVSLATTFLDSTSGVSQVRYGNDVVWDTEPWESPLLTKEWSLAPGDGGKNVYFQIKDDAGLISITYSDGINLDTTMPLGSIHIDYDDAWTTSNSVMLSLGYSDGTSGVAQVRFSNDDIWDTEPWESPTTTRTWMLSPGEGSKTVYYQVKDNVGWLSATYSDCIGLDTTPPTGSLLINDGDEKAESTSVVLYLTYSDQGSGVYQVRYSNDGVFDT
ncbi:MAG: hypothetical protein KAW09_11200, partial [Thermoplasmata archaeon]|nr:hypothetical protein [Thermoplasmata archaeon]